MFTEKIVFGKTTLDGLGWVRLGVISKKQRKHCYKHSGLVCELDRTRRTGRTLFKSYLADTDNKELSGLNILVFYSIMLINHNKS